MPRHAKSNKLQRARGMIAGLKKHAVQLVSPWIDSAAAAARYQAHLKALDTVAATHAAWMQAVRDEMRLERDIKKLTERLRQYVQGVLGEDSLRDFGLKPRKKAYISAEKMLRTVEKRNATRKARGTMGKRQKRTLKRAR
jgi:hypothetical protein